MRNFLPGNRIIKTVLSVLICLCIARLINYDSPYFACIASVIVMKSTPELSFKFGKSRIIGSLFGAFFAALFVVITKVLGISDESFLYVVLISIVLMLDLTLVKIMGFSENATSLSAILVLSVLMSHNQDMTEMLGYITMRMIETIVGVSIAVVVNKNLLNQPEV